MLTQRPFSRTISSFIIPYFPILEFIESAKQAEGTKPFSSLIATEIRPMVPRQANQEQPEGPHKRDQASPNKTRPCHPGNVNW
jgi:hypothetical protein